MQRIDTLTGIRGLTAIWVILFHTYFPESDSERRIEGVFSTFASRGWLGVDLFFVLSGFVIAHVYTKKMQTFSWKQVRDFLRRRFARIYPNHFVVLGLFLLYVLAASTLGLNFNREHYSCGSFLTQLFMLNGIGLPVAHGWNYVSWSISAEFAAYLLFPFLAPMMSRVSGKLATAWIAVIFGITFAAAMIVNDGKAYMMPWGGTLLRVLSEFSVGALSYHIFRSGIPAHIATYLAPALLLLILLVAGISEHPLTDGYLVMLFAIFIPTIAADHRSLVARFLLTKPMIKLGEISFSVYLIQNLVEIVINYSGKNFPKFGSLLITMPATAVVINTVASIIAGSILYHTIERNAQRLLLANAQ